MTPFSIGHVDSRIDTSTRWSSIYVRSYLWLRIGIGGIGLLLPFALIVFVDLVEGDNPATRGSFSAYYWTGARDIFVGSLCVIGVFLVGYKFSAGSGSSAKESRMSTIAGIAAILVALFPTSRPTDGPDSFMPALTPLQQTLTESLVRTVHYAAAATFILMLAYIVFHFAEAEGPNTTRPAHLVESQRFTPRQWQLFHRMCGTAILLAVAALALIKLFNGPDRYALFIVELVATVAFSLSWFAKGAEWRILKLAVPAEAR